MDVVHDSFLKLPQEPVIDTLTSNTTNFQEFSPKAIQKPILDFYTNFAAAQIEIIPKDLLLNLQETFTASIPTPNFDIDIFFGKSNDAEVELL